MKRKITAKDYVKLIEWSEQDRCFIGSAPPLIGPCCHGADEQQVFRQLVRIVDEWIAIHEQDGRTLPPPSANKKYSGKFVLRLDPQLHRLLALKAMQSGDSLNSYATKALAR